MKSDLGTRALTALAMVAVAGVALWLGGWFWAVFVGLIAALGYGAVFSLANFVKYKPREIVVTVPPDKFLKQPR